MKLLLTAFEPFGGETINPAQEAVKLLPEQLGSVTIVKCDVPTVFGKSVEIVTDAIALHRPDAVGDIVKGIEAAIRAIESHKTASVHGTSANHE